MYYYDPYLAHYGVKGMKWGVRRHRDDVVVRKGHKIQRISTSTESDKRSDRKTAYTSYLRSDRKKYADHFAKALKLEKSSTIQMLLVSETMCTRSHIEAKTT